ncbi:head maturation protease, ClpP-related [Planctomicrobium sp. SH661]|uniref:head maturation protease, ClpP-related n=1 Tax=Planctomicrobium sp. SH661 TaxID=3448124 RepID=UPI003F5B9703
MSSTKNATNAAKEPPELHILDDIGPSWAGMMGAKWLAGELKAIGNDAPKISVRMNSYGGEVFEGLTMYNLLKDHPASIHMHIDGVAASIASIIAMAGDTISMAAGSYLMIHNPWTVAVGEAGDLRHSADLLDSLTDTLAEVYASRSGKTKGEFLDLMAKETWIDAEKAVSLGLATEVSSNKQAIVNSLSPKLYSLETVPDGLRRCATLAAKLNARIDSIDRDTMDCRTRGHLVAKLMQSAQGTGAEGVRIPEILAGKADCQTEAALELFSNVLEIPMDDLKAAHAEDGCRCQSDSIITSKVDHRAQIAAWKVVGQRIGK